METSHLRLIQFSIIIALLSLGAVFWWNRDSTSEASITVNAPQESHIATTVRGYWKMDEGTGTSTTADSSGNANTLTMTSMEVGDWVAGNIGPYSLDFDGSAEYLTVTDPASGVLDFVEGTSFTLTGWFNRDTFANDHTIIAKKTVQDTNTADGYIVWVDGTDDLLHVRADENGSTDAYSITSTSAFTSTGWNHFAVSWNDSATTNPVNVYVNGALDGDADQGSGTFAAVGTLANSEAFRIGAESGTADNFFDGKIDDVRVYGFPLSADEVQKLYQTTAPMQVQLDSGLVGYWTFNGPDIKGSTVIDRSGKGNDGTITGAVPVKGKLGQGMGFDGTSDMVSTVSNVNLATASVSFWFKTEDIHVDVTDTIISGGYDLYCIAPYYDNKLGCSNDALNDVTTSTITIVDNRWHHGVFTFTNGSQKLYVDGNLEGTGTVAYSSDSGLITIGTDFQERSAFFFPGQIDDVSLYNRILSASEVLSLYNISK